MGLELWALMIFCILVLVSTKIAAIKFIMKMYPDNFVKKDKKNGNL